jgi:hypothetical protein
MLLFHANCLLHLAAAGPSTPVSVRRYVMSEAVGFDTELDNTWVNETEPMTAATTALVM